LTLNKVTLVNCVINWDDDEDLAQQLTLNLSISEEEIEDHDVRADNISKALSQLAKALTRYVDEDLIDLDLAVMLMDKFAEQCRDFHRLMGAGNVKWSRCPQCNAPCVTGNMCDGICKICFRKNNDIN
jgi:hypothetical protein